MAIAKTFLLIGRRVNYKCGSLHVMLTPYNMSLEKIKLLDGYEVVLDTIEAYDECFYLDEVKDITLWEIMCVYWPALRHIPETYTLMAQYVTHADVLSPKAISWDSTLLWMCRINRESLR